MCISLPACNFQFTAKNVLLKIRYVILDKKWMHFGKLPFNYEGCVLRISATFFLRETWRMEI